MSFIGKKIREGREGRGWTQQQLATRAGYHQGDVSDWEQGKVIPQTPSLIRLAQAFRKPLTYFFDINKASKNDLKGITNDQQLIEFLLVRLRALETEIKELKGGKE